MVEYSNIYALLLKVIFYVMISQMVRMLMPSSLLEGESVIIVGMNLFYLLVDGIKNLLPFL